VLAVGGEEDVAVGALDVLPAAEDRDQARDVAVADVVLGAARPEPARGVRLEDGKTAPADVSRRGEREIEITIREGRKRQVRRMAEAIGNEAESLSRIRIGSLGLGELRRGEARRLGEGEVAALWKDSAP